MHRIDTQRIGHRQQHRRQDQDDRRHVHQGANQQQHDVEVHQNDVLVVRQRSEELGDTHRQLHVGHHRAKRRCEADQNHHDGHRLHRATHQLRQFIPLVVAVDKHGDKERPQAGDRGGFRCGKDPRQNAAKNDHHRHQPPQGIEEDLQRLFKRHSFTFWIPPLARKAQAQHHQA